MCQFAKGTHSQGARSQVTSGQHLNEIAEIIRKDLMRIGYSEEKVYYAIELRSINSSFGKNLINRSEASNAAFAIKMV